MASERYTMYRPNADKTDVIVQYPLTIADQVYDFEKGQFLDETLREVSLKIEQNKKHNVGWINVKEAPYNAKGDGITNDTSAFIGAMNDLSNAGGGTLYVPYGNYRLTSITIPRNVTFKMDKGVFEYALENWSLNANDTSVLNNTLIKHDDSETMIICHGHMENVRVNGNRKLGTAVEMRGTFDGLQITRAKRALYIARSGYQYKNFFLGGNLGDALVIGEGVADTRFELFNIWSNLGHGCVISNGCGTINFTNGKIEWNYKNSVEVTGYTHEITFDNMILDAPAWYNLHLSPSAQALDWKFSDTNFIGGRRDPVSIVYGQSTFPISYTNATTSQIFLESSHFDCNFSNVFFRKLNARHDATIPNEKITHILGGNGVTISYPMTFSACDCSDFPYANLKTGVEIYVHNIIGTRFSDSPNFMGGVVTGEIVLPIATGSNLSSYGTKKSGGVIFNSDDKSLNVWLWGNNYKVRTNTFVNVPATATATGSVGSYAADANYLYICYATNNWIRIAKDTW